MRIKILILELEGLMAESGSGQVNEANLAFWLAGPSKLLGISHIGPRLKKFLFYSHINKYFLLTKLVQSSLYIGLILSSLPHSRF